jgi:hypothetical protein
MLADSLLKQIGYDIKRFADLPESHKMAIVWYMACDGGAWDVLGDIEDAPMGDLVEAARLAREALPLYVEQYGDVEFGVATAPAGLFKAAMMSDPEIAEAFSCWDDYAAWYAANRDVPNHSEMDRWPAILSDHADEIIQDGSHRSHAYIAAGHADIPLIFYPEDHHKIALV